jgi:hypothetical protein
MATDDLVNQIKALQESLHSLEQKVQYLEANSPQTWLLSDNFLKRAFAVMGHYLVASLIIGIPFYIIMILLMLMFGGFNW